MVKVLLALVFLTAVTFAAKFDGTVSRRGSGFWFMGVFAFDYDKGGSTVGTIDVQLEASLADAPQLEEMELLLYDDEDSSWPEVYGKSLSCDDWRTKAKNYPRIFSPDYQVVWDISGDKARWNSTASITQQLRPRFWYVVLSSCSEGSGHVDFKVHFVNTLHTSWDEEFGMNEMGEQTLYLIFILFYSFFILLQSYACYQFYKKQKYVHALIKGFTLSLFLQWLYVLIKTIHFGSFASDGYGVPICDQLGDVVDVAARIVFIVILLLLAAGWTISSRPGEIQGKWPIMVFVSLLFIAWVSILIYGFVAVDPEDVNIPASLQGLQYFLLVVWFLLAFWFIARSFVAFRGEDNPVKKLLYLRMGVLYGVWFLGLPFVVLLSYFLSPWVREKIIVSFDMVITFIGYCAGAFLLWPTRAEEYFAVEKPNVSEGLQHYEHL